MLEHILYCNDNADVLVLDLPTSIARAQASTKQLYSTPAIDVPHSTPEPKGSKRDVLLSRIPDGERRHHVEIQHTIRATLTSLHEQSGLTYWCHPRASVGNSDSPAAEYDCPSHSNEQVLKVKSPIPPLVLSSSQTGFCCSAAFVNAVAHNPHSHSAEIDVAAQGRFIIPPRSTFICATIEDGWGVFIEAVNCLLPRSKFDLVLLDPPWKNRSVRHSRAYHSAEYQLTDPFETVLPTIIDFLSDCGIIAVWITSKATVRAQVTEICSRHGLVLAEEWIWLKVTSKGEPVSAIDGLWKKPYETVLLFRRGGQVVKTIRRIGIAVPDVHSRKPSLKSMFEQLLPPDYNALEVFARSLTAGWWSWGDEVLKFQHESNWY